MATSAAFNYTSIFIPLQPMNAISHEDWVGCIKNGCSDYVLDYVLSGRIVSNWQECVMIAGIAIAVIGFAITFFTSSSVICTSFALLLGSSVTGLFCARKYGTLANLQNTVQDLQQTRGRLEGIANNLERENTRLEATNQNLETRVQEFEAANQVFAQNNQQLAQTNQRLEATNQNLEVRAQEFEAANQVFAQNNQQLTQNNERLEATNQNLEARAEQFEAANQEFAQNNQQLTEANQQLRTTNTHLEERVEDLETTNEQLQETARGLAETNQNLEGRNEELRLRVTDLALQVTELTRSAEAIRVEMINFREANVALGVDVAGFDASLTVLNEQISTSRGICTLIENHLATHQRGLAEQLIELRRLITDADERTREKLAQLNLLHEKIHASTVELHAIEVKYANEQGRLEGIGDAFSFLQQQFAATSQTLQLNVAGVAEERNALQTQTSLLQSLLQSQADRIQNIINRFLPPPSRDILPPSPREGNFARLNLLPAGISV